VARGIEAWAEDTARALLEYGNDEHPTSNIQRSTSNSWRGVRGTKSEKDEEGGEHSTFNTQQSAGLKVTLFGAWHSNTPTPTPVDSPTLPDSLPLPLRVSLPCLRRGDWLARFLARTMPGFTWRWGLKSAYGWEQLTFWRRLEPELRRGNFDILHVQDPMLAYWCRRARQAGRLRTQEILAHGTEECVEFLMQFEFVQHLAPWHLEQVRKRLARDGGSVE
jgi:hypothetical protein